MPGVRLCHLCFRCRKDTAIEFIFNPLIGVFFVAFTLLYKSAMRKHKLPSHIVFAVALTLFSLNTLSLAQESRVNSRADIPLLIKKLKDNKEDVALQAARELSDIGQPVVLPLSEFLKKEKDCRSRVLAATLLLGLAPDSEIIVSGMLDVLKNGCYFSPRKDISVRQDAAFLLTSTAKGISALAELLKGKSAFGRFERRSVVFAFDELTEKIEGARPDSTTPTPEIISAVKAAIPLLILALDDKDEIVHCMAYESLEQLQASKHVELRNEANRLMQRVKVRCSK
jgi:HEAT repeat protein